MPRISKRLRSLLFFLVPAFVCAGLFALHIHRAALPQAHPPRTTNAKIAPKPAVESETWPRWGGALNSAELSGKNFFDKDAARAVGYSIEPSLRAYIVELNSRAFLPMTQSGDVFPERENMAPRTAYLQFLAHPTDEQRKQLARSGVALLSYVSGYAWLAQGSADALLDAARLPYVRALAGVDARDKLQRGVFLQQAPAYALWCGLPACAGWKPAPQLAGDNAVRFQWVAARGTSLESMSSQLHAFPALADLQIKSGPSPCVFGPRFEASARADLAVTIASAESVLFVEYAAPPAAPRDATTDSSSNIAAVRDAGDEVDGSGIQVAVREIGKPELHLDFAARMTFVDTDGDTSTPFIYQHATAVVGQVASNGVNQPAAKGVAPAAQVLVYSLMDGDFATADVLDAASKGARISNHSYGPGKLVRLRRLRNRLRRLGRRAAQFQRAWHFRRQRRERRRQIQSHRLLRRHEKWPVSRSFLRDGQGRRPFRESARFEIRRQRLLCEIRPDDRRPHQARSCSVRRQRDPGRGHRFHDPEFWNLVLDARVHKASPRSYFSATKWSTE